MTHALRNLSSIAALAAVLGASLALPAHAQDSRSEDRLKHFQMPMMDANKDGMVSKKEFMDTMSMMWDTQMSDAAKAAAGGKEKSKDRMTLEQYREFAKMFGLNVGS